MFQKVLRVVLIAVLLMFSVNAVQPALAQDQPPGVQPGQPAQEVPTPPSPLSDPGRSTTAAQLTAPDNWESQTFDISPIPDPAAPDATITVNSTADLGDANPGNGVCAASNGACTLRAALEEANATTATDEVIVPAGVYVINVGFTLTKQITISGAGRDATIIDGNNNTRVFLNAANSGSNTIRNLTIRNAWNKITTFPWRDGGGIFNDGTLTLRNVTVTGCRGYQGGGVYNGYDGGQPNKRTLYMENVILSNNVATSTTLGEGGGGLFNGSRLNGVNVTITGNTANMQGGGFYNNSYEQEIVLRNFVISNNQSLDGGGIMNDYTKFDLGYGITLTDGEVSNNRASCCYQPNQGVPAGGIDNNMGIMRLTNVAVYGNSVPNGGGTLYGYGGGIVNIQYMDLTNSSVTGNTAYLGAGIYNGNYANYGNKLTLVNTTISGNQGLNLAAGTMGAGLFNVGVGQVQLTNSTITQNRAGAVGGVRVMAGTVAMKNTILSGNYDSTGAQDCAGAITSQGYNLVGNAAGAPRVNLGCTFAATTGDIVNVVPALGPLLRFGYPAFHPLVAGSQAIDKGTNSGCPSVDVNGDKRPLGASCDVGADEYNSNIVLHNLFAPLIRKK